MSRRRLSNSAPYFDFSSVVSAGTTMSVRDQTPERLPRFLVPLPLVGEQILQVDRRG